MNKVVSVIIPVYNVQEYLENCIETVINQTYNNIEIILIDDGSTDNSGLICDEYAKKDKRIKVIHKKNQGLSSARNAGLDIAKGDYFICVDSDDYLKSTCIQELLEYLILYDCDISACGTLYCDKDNKVIKEESSKETKVYADDEQMKRLLSTQEISTTAWGKLYKSELFNNIRYPIGKYHEDTYTTYKLLAKSKKTVVVNKALYYYRKVPNSIMNKSFSKKHLDGMYGAIERARFIDKEFPKLKKYAYATIGHVSCTCFERIIKANYRDGRIERKIKDNIRNNILYMLLFSRCALKTKMFAIICCIDMDLCRKIYKKIMNGDKR